MLQVTKKVYVARSQRKVRCVASSQKICIYRKQPKQIYIYNVASSQQGISGHRL